MTTDFLLVLQTPSKNLELLAVAFKPKADLSNRRTRELLNIEREYWLARGVTWLLITPELFDKQVALRLRDTMPWALGTTVSENDLSKEEVGIQISDVIAGLLGRHFTYIRNHTLPELRNRKSTFSQIQQRNLEMLRTLIDRSDAYSDGFFHVVLPLDTIFKNNTFLHECEAPPYMG